MPTLPLKAKLWLCTSMYTANDIRGLHFRGSFQIKLHKFPWCGYAGAVMHVEITNPRWRGKRSRHSRRMRNPQFYVSGKRPIWPGPCLTLSFYALLKKIKISSRLLWPGLMSVLPRYILSRYIEFSYLLSFHNRSKDLCFGILLHDVVITCTYTGLMLVYSLFNIAQNNSTNWIFH